MKTVHSNPSHTNTVRSSVGIKPVPTQHVPKSTASLSSRQSSTPTATPHYSHDFNSLPGNPDPNEVTIISATTIKHTGIKSSKPTGIVNPDQSEMGAGNRIGIGEGLFGFGVLWSILGSFMISLYLANGL
ncbi:11650_t:CDS:1 [Acaulospora colombiana]|uniref:11650_t:CDS:1 n=1 Tax=Acaulospora colombiana TaxID=27376 RepID=A0ACA9LG48_9GLOM|nr:11650_t:CDS:1 [Acaulospora colombiana]